MAIRQGKIIAAVVFSLLFLGLFFKADAANLSLRPSAGTFPIDSVFDVSVLLDTEGESINAVDIKILFPPDKLQVVSPSAGQSIIGVWTAQPTYNNQTGEIRLQGGVPGGVNTSMGLISRLTFRVKQIGQAIIKFGDGSKVLLNDGKGTDVLENTVNGVFRLILPLPAGPIVASETHRDSSLWYANPNAIITWANALPVEGYSYILSQQPLELPDDISEGVRTSVAYSNLPSGTHYFHIKALRDGNWGGLTHFAINVDTEPPADFKIEVSPSARSSSKTLIAKFATTDNDSGINRYEYKVVSLSLKTQAALFNALNQNFFIKAQSPAVLNFQETGTYDFIVRAYDNAGNLQEGTQRISVVNPILKIVSGKGVEIGGKLTIPWLWSIITALAVIFLLGFSGWHIRKWHHRIDIQKAKRELPDHVKEQLDELKKYRARYGHVAILIGLAIGLAGLVMASPVSHAQEVELAPPYVSTVSRNISNDEIFYIGGKTDINNVDVIIYLQNLQTGETISQTVTSNKKGEWFYRHQNFLLSGNYLLWTQAKLNDQLSPPSPQIQMQVRRTAIQFGASRFSYETFYGILVIVFFLIILGLLGFMVYHGYHGRKKRQAFWKEIKEAEESIRRGFAVLRRDIEAELSVIGKIKMAKNLSLEEKKREEQLLRDLDWVQKYITKEVWDVERFTPNT